MTRLFSLGRSNRAASQEKLQSPVDVFYGLVIKIMVFIFLNRAQTQI